MSFSTNDRRRVLLIDHNNLKQQIRAAVLRNCEVEVHTANSITDAGQLWTKCSYDLVLFAAEEHSDEAMLLCGEIRKAKPRQRIALLVGAPQYVREIGRRRKESGTLLSVPRPDIGIPQPQPTQWQGTIDRLLAS
jgi:response regulator RpfG family c-di-GMP phosphodiesterase